MAQVSGKYLDDLEERLVKWAADYTLRMEEKLKETYPYNSTPLTEQEMLTRFLDMSGPDYAKLVAILNEKYRGQPDVYDRVNRELADFLSAQLAAAAKEL